MQLAAQPAWHQLHITEVAGLLKTDLATGLSQSEVQSRLRQRRFGLAVELAR
jgi:hypothetical protein